MFPVCGEIVITNPIVSFYAICSPDRSGLCNCGFLLRYLSSIRDLGRPQETGLRPPAPQPDSPRTVDGAPVPARPGVGTVPGGRRGRDGGKLPVGSRQGAALGLQPGEMRPGREAGGGGRWGQHFSPGAAPKVSGRPCVSMSVSSRVHSALEAACLPTCPAFSRVLPSRSGGKRAAPAPDPPGTQNRSFLCRARERELKFV